MATATSYAQDGNLVVTSSAFTNNGMMPSKYSCEGKKVSPPLHLAHIPQGTKSIAITMHDPDAPIEGGFTHWTVWNIPTDMHLELDIPENFTKGTQGLNSTGKTGYVGMCPPSGTHHYHIVVYALDTKLPQGAETNKTQLEGALAGHIKGQAEIVGLYKKMK